MAKLTKYIKNPYTKEFVRIEANSFDELNNYEKFQRELWDKTKGVSITNYKSVVNKSVESHRETLRMFSEIVVRNLDKVINYTDFYKNQNEEDLKLVFEPRIKKPNKEILFDKLGVPKKMSLIEKFSRETFERRIKAEAEAQKIFDKLMFEYKKNYTIDLSSFEEKVQAQLAEIRSQNNEINKQLSKFLNKNKYEVELILRKIFESKRYIDNITGISKKSSMIFDYKPIEELVVITRELPSISDLPTYSELRWDESKKEVVKIDWDKRDLLNFHEDVISQITLITIRDVFCSIPEDIVNKVYFKGYFKNINNTEDSKLDKNLSIYVTRDYFLSIDLLHCDYRACITDLQAIIRPSFIEVINNQSAEIINSKVKGSATKKEIQDNQVNVIKVSSSPLSKQEKDLKIKKKPRKTTQKDYLKSTTKSHILSKSIQESEPKITKKTKKKISEDNPEIFTNSSDYQDKVRKSKHEFIEHPRSRSVANKSEKIEVEQEIPKVIKVTTNSQQRKNADTSNRTYSEGWSNNQYKADIKYVSIKRKPKKRIKPDFDLDFDD